MAASVALDSPVILGDWACSSETDTAVGGSVEGARGAATAVGDVVSAMATTATRLTTRDFMIISTAFTAR